MTVWLLATFIMTCVYKSKLTALLSSMKTEEFGSVDKLVQHGYNFFVSAL